jgi:peptide chain release factor subunit 1
VEGGYLTAELKDKVIAIKDLSYTGDFGMEELVEKSEDVLAAEGVAEEKKVMGEFFDKLARNPGNVAYGEADTLSKLKIGAVDRVLLSDELDDNKIGMFEMEAKNVGSEIIIVSTETREGVQLKEMGGIAAILRYEVNE